MCMRVGYAEMPNGQTTIYGVCTFSKCVGVLPFVGKDSVILVRQYRYVQREDFRWEMPTGGIRPGAAAEEGAQRELAQEAGRRAGRLVPINVYYTPKSLCGEKASLYLGSDLSRHHTPPARTR